MTVLTAYIGRDNEDKIQLLQDSVVVTAGVVTRAVFKFGDYCIDTEIDTDVIYFDDSDNQVLCLKLGLIDDLSPLSGTISGQLTLFDNTNTNGIAWVLVPVLIKTWTLCS